MSLVSVVIPAFNSASILESSILSLVNQTLENIEIIIVNDASTDNTKDIAEALENNYPYIKVINLSDNQGVYRARAIGIEKATSEWIGFLDADDYARPDMFKSLLEATELDEVDIVLCEVDRVTPERKVISEKVRFNSEGVCDHKIFERFCKFEFGTNALWNKLYRASLVKRWGTIEHRVRQDINEDALINIGCFHDARSVYLLKRPLYEYVFNPDGVTSKMDRSSAFLSMIQAYFLALDIYREFDYKSLNLITDLYKMQLDWKDYTPDILELPNEKVSVLVPLVKNGLDIYPQGLMTLLSRKPHKALRIFNKDVSPFFRKLKAWIFD